MLPVTYVPLKQVAKSSIDSAEVYTRDILFSRVKEEKKGGRS